MAERHNSSDHKAFRAALTKSAQEPESEPKMPLVCGFWCHCLQAATNKQLSPFAICAYYPATNPVVIVIDNDRSQPALNENLHTGLETKNQWLRSEP
jgi:hypothetical protein